MEGAVSRPKELLHQHLHHHSPALLLEDDDYDRIVVALKRAFAGARAEAEMQREWAGWG
jgi:hypothetical protein